MTVTLDRLLKACPLSRFPKGFRPDHVRKPPRGPAKREPRLGELAPQETVDEIMRLVHLGGDGWAQQWVVDTLGVEAASREYSETTARRRAERARIMEAAWEEFLAGQYPNIRVRVRWGAIVNGRLTAGENPTTANAGTQKTASLFSRIAAARKNRGWRVLVRFEVR